VRVSPTGHPGCHSALVTRLLATRTQVALLVVALLAGLGVLGAIGWVTWSARAAAAVSTGWQPDCGEARVGSHRGEPAIWSRPGWRCEVDVAVVNDSARELRVTEVSARMVGPGSTLEARSLPTDTAPVGQSPGSDDARWDVDVTVPAHASRTITVAIGWRQDGCNTSGYVTTRPWATVRFQVLGRTHAVTAPQPLVLRTFDEPRDRRACPEE